MSPTMSRPWAEDAQGDQAGTNTPDPMKARLLRLFMDALTFGVVFVLTWGIIILWCFNTRCRW